MTSIEGLAAGLADRYRIEREVGAGGMATVHLARDLKHDRAVAIKVLHPDIAAVLGVERFLAEIKTTARLQHPHILPLLDSGEAAGRLYYVMPYVEGETLRERLERERQLPIEDAVRLAGEVADALGYAHAQGIIHRDIKPENILLQGGHALVADFGIALAVQSASGSRLTQTGLSLGTPQYMSPEQAMGERAIDARTDLYALGAVTYEMLTGEPPFTGPTVQVIVAKVMSERPVAPRTLRDTVPLPVEAAVLKALAKLPADRFATAEGYALALRAEHRFENPPARSGPAGHPRFHPLVIAAGLLGAAAITVVALQGRLGPAGSNSELLRYSYTIRANNTWRNENRLALSPDGGRLAFVAPGDDGVPRIWIRTRADLDATPVEGTEGALSVVYSPDGARLGFLTDDPLVLKVATPGTAPVTIARMRAGIAGGVGGAWPSTETMYVGGAGFPTIMRVGLADGSIAPVSTLDTANGEVWHGQPDVSPGEKAVLFTVADRSLQVAEYRIALGDLASRRHRILMKGVRAWYDGRGSLLIASADGGLSMAPFDAGKGVLTGAATPIGTGLPIRSLATVDLAVSRSGRLAWVSGQSSSRSVPPDSVQLTWVTPDGRLTPVDSSWSLRNPGQFRLSPDGSRIAVTVIGPQGPDVWVRTIRSGLMTRLTSDGASGPTFSPDGRLVLYRRTTRSAGELFARPVDASGPERLYLRMPTAINVDLAWTPDRGRVVYETWRRTGEDLVTTRPGVDSGFTALLESEFNEMTPRLSPDGKWLAYVSDESGRLELYARPFPEVNKARWQISPQGGIGPVWAPDGRQLFYFDLNGVAQGVAFDGGAANPVGAVRRLFSSSPWRYVGGPLRPSYDVAPGDGRFLVARRIAPALPDQQVVITENYQALGTSRR